MLSFPTVCVLQDSLKHKEERIEELEEALRESVQITAEREVVLAHEEQARTHAEKQVPTVPPAKALPHVQPNSSNLTFTSCLCVKIPSFSESLWDKHSNKYKGTNPDIVTSHSQKWLMVAARDMPCANWAHSGVAQRVCPVTPHLVEM